MINGVTTSYVGNTFEWTGSASIMVKYYFEGSARLAERQGTGAAQYFLDDHLGSTSLAVDSNGNLTAELRYKAWGETRYTNGSTPTTYKYTGQKQEAALGGADGLYFYNARWYDPTLGRFISPDMVTPVKSQGVQAYDRYAYSNNNPTNYTDPSGHFAYTPANTDECGPDGIYCLPDGEQIKSNPALSSAPAPKNSTPVSNLIKKLPFSSYFYSASVLAFDSAAGLTDLYASAVVTFGLIVGAGIPTALLPEGVPEVPISTGGPGMAIAELFVQPLLFGANVLSGFGTAATFISDTKSGTTVVEKGVISSSTANSVTLFCLGLVDREAYTSLIIQGLDISNDLRLTSFPWP